MRDLYVKKLETTDKMKLDEASHLLESKAVTHRIDRVNWESFSYKPDVKFRIAHTGDEIWLKFYVRENHILARETRTNGEVYKDSCVEFFISVDGVNYYNFEFSCIGTIHLAHGPDRHIRKFIPENTIRKIEISSSLGTKPFEEQTGDFNWEMMIRIPRECFQFDQLNSFHQLKATANFYKCGDATALPHYVTWNPIKTENPDYHQPGFFGNLQFE